MAIEKLKELVDYKLSAGCGSWQGICRKTTSSAIHSEQVAYPRLRCGTFVFGINYAFELGHGAFYGLRFGISLAAITMQNTSYYDIHVLIIETIHEDCVVKKVIISEGLKFLIIL